MRTRLRKRVKLVAEFGGACEQCGYKRCIRALHFHHRDPDEKYEWGSRGNASLKEVAAHPERFRLLCANCHAEAHHAEAEAKKRYTECEHCGKRFQTYNHRKKTSRGKYCSPRCHHAQRGKDAYTSHTERFWRHVNTSGDCWPWTGYATKGGTPVLSVKREDGTHAPRSARKVSYEIHFGPAEGKRIRLSCQNSLCVRPDHLVHS